MIYQNKIVLLVLILIFSAAMSTPAFALDEFWSESFEQPPLAAWDDFDKNLIPQNWRAGRFCSTNPQRGGRANFSWRGIVRNGWSLPENQQAYSIRHFHTGATTMENAIGPYEHGQRYVVSFDVIKDADERFTQSEGNYQVELLAYDASATTDDNRNCVYKYPGDHATVLASIDGAASSTNERLGFEFSPTAAHAQYDGYDLVVRLRGMRSGTSENTAGLHAGVVFDNLSLAREPVTIESPELPPNSDPGDNASLVSSTLVALPAGALLSLEHRYTTGLTTRSYHRNLTPQTMSFSASNTDTERPTMFVSASLALSNPDETWNWNNRGGLILEATLERETGAYSGIRQQIYPECNEMIGIQSSKDGGLVAALCRRPKQASGATAAGDSEVVDLVENYKAQFDSSKLIVDDAQDEMWLYEWTNGDIQSTPDKYIVNKSIGGTEHGQFSLIFGEEDNTYGIALKVKQPGGHQSDSFVVVDRSTNPYRIEKLAEDGFGGRGWGNSCGPGHTIHNRLGFNPTTLQYGVLCGADDHWPRVNRNNPHTDGNYSYGSINFASDHRTQGVTDNEKARLLLVQQSQGRFKGGPAAIRPLGDGWLGVLVGVEGDVDEGDLDYYSDGERHHLIPAAPATQIGLVRLDENGGLVGNVNFVADSEPNHVSYPQLVPLENGNFLLGYGVMPADSTSSPNYAELHQGLITPSEFWVMEIDASGNPVGAARRLADDGWSEMDEMISLGGLTAGWASYEVVDGEANPMALKLHAMHTTPLASIEEPANDGVPDGVVCRPGEFVKSHESIYAAGDDTMRGFRIWCATQFEDTEIRQSTGIRNPADDAGLRASDCAPDGRMVGIWGKSEPSLNPTETVYMGAHCEWSDGTVTPPVDTSGFQSVSELEIYGNSEHIFDARCSDDMMLTGIAANYDSDTQAHTSIDAVCGFRASVRQYDHEISAPRTCPAGSSVANIVVHPGIGGLPGRIEFVCTDGNQNTAWRNVGGFAEPPADPNNVTGQCTNGSHAAGLLVDTAQLAGGGYEGLVRLEIVCSDDADLLDNPQVSTCPNGGVMTGVGTFLNDEQVFGDVVPPFARAYPLCDGETGDQAPTDTGSTSGEPPVDTTAECFLSDDESGPGTSALCKTEEPPLRVGTGQPAYLVSPDGRYRANIFKKLSINLHANGAIIETWTNAPPPAPSPYFRSMRGGLTQDGEFALFDTSNNQLWGTGTAGSDANYLLLKNDGHLYLECIDGSAVWSTNDDYPIVSQCADPVIQGRLASIEQGQKLGVAEQLLCSDPATHASLCPSGKRYQFLSMSDSFVYVDGEEEDSAHLTEALSQIPLVSQYGAVSFLIDSWNEREVVQTRCLDRDDNGLNNCFVTRANVIAESLFESIPEDATYSETMDIRGTTQKIPNITMPDGKVFAMNQCHRHMTNAFYLDSPETVISLSADVDKFVQRYFPKVDCVFDARTEQSIASTTAGYKDSSTAILATTMHVVQFAEVTALQAIPVVLTDGAFSLVLAGTEAEYILNAARWLGEVVGAGMAASGILQEFAELRSCESAPCKTRAITDIVVNAGMLGLQAYQKALDNGLIGEQARAKGIATSMIALSDEAARANSMLSGVELSTEQLNHYRLMALSSRDPNFAAIAKDPSVSASFVDTILQLPDSAFKDAGFVEEFITKTGEIANDPNGSLNQVKLEEYRLELEAFTQLLEGGCI